MNAVILQSVVERIKSRLAAADRLRFVKCPWCLESQSEIALAQVEALDRIRELANYGFHCVLHAETFHEFAKLDKYMRFSCCNPDIIFSDELTEMMGKLNLED
jgi:hypothetical protein